MEKLWGQSGALVWVSGLCRTGRTLTFQEQSGGLCFSGAFSDTFACLCVFFPSFVFIVCVREVKHRFQLLLFFNVSSEKGSGHLRSTFPCRGGLGGFKCVDAEGCLMLGRPCWVRWLTSLLVDLLGTPWPSLPVSEKAWFPQCVPRSAGVDLLSCSDLLSDVSRWVLLVVVFLNKLSVFVQPRPLDEAVCSKYK